MSMLLSISAFFQLLCSSYVVLIFYYFIYLIIYLFIYFWPCCMACQILVPQPGIEPVSPAVETWSPNHWTTREFPVFLLF